MAFEALEAKLIELFIENALFRYSRDRIANIKLTLTKFFSPSSLQVLWDSARST